MNTARKSRRALLAGALCLALTNAAPAWAGTAKVYSCQLPDGAAAPTDGWTEETNSAGQLYVDGANRCSRGGALSGEFFYPGNSWSAGPYSGWRFTAPVNTTVAEIAFDRTLYGIGGGHWNYIVYVGGVRADLIAPAGNSGWTRRTHAGGDATNVAIRLVCGGPGTCQRTSESTSAAAVGIRRVVTTLRDVDDPSVEGVAGGLATSDVLRGTETMTFSASDAGMGVYRRIVEVDGREVSSAVVDANDGRCADAGQDADSPHEFLHRVPCKLSANGDASLDTTQLPDGDHVLRVRVEDAAGNSTTASGPRTVRVDNVPAPTPKGGSRPTIQGSPRAGEALRGIPGEWDGDNLSFSYQWLRCDADGGSCVELGTGTGQQHLVSSRDVGHRLRVRVTATNAEGSSSATSAPTAVVAPPSTTENRVPTPQQPASPGAGSTGRGAPNGTGASDRVRLSAYAGTGRRTTIRARYGRSTRITGRLIDTRNQPIAGATLQVQTGVRIAGSPFEEVGTVRTDRNGRYTYTLAAGPSRLVRFGYRSHVGDTQFADTTDVVVMVRAGVTLRPRPTRLRNGRTATFRGTVARPVPRRGVLVDLQVRVGKKWRTFAVARSKRNGRYSFRYRFRNTYRTTTFKFRARVRRDSRYPYLDGYSRIAKVKVRG